MKNKGFRWIFSVLISVLIISFSVIEVKSQSEYPVYLPIIQTRFTVYPQNRAESLNFYNSNYLITNPPAINWTGSHLNCDPGTTDPAFQLEVLKRINYFRAMAGVPDRITFSEDSNLKAQAAALVMSVNGDLDHTPPDTWICYSELAYQGASSSNLFLGVYGWNAITGYMYDPGTSNYAVGHRRWILYPQTQIMGSGDIPPTAGYFASNALRVFDEYLWSPRPNTRDGFVAWPPSGYVPYTVVFPRWSFSCPAADFSLAQVTMSQGSQNLSLKIEEVVDGYGENTLVWQLEEISDGSSWPRPLQDTPYSVNIQNVVIGGEVFDFSYQVIIFDPSS